MPFFSCCSGSTRSLSIPPDAAPTISRSSFPKKGSDTSRDDAVPSVRDDSGPATKDNFKARGLFNDALLPGQLPDLSRGAALGYMVEEDKKGVPLLEDTLCSSGNSGSRLGSDNSAGRLLPTPSAPHGLDIPPELRSTTCFFDADYLDGEQATSPACVSDIVRTHPSSRTAALGASGHSAAHGPSAADAAQLWCYLLDPPLQQAISRTSGNRWLYKLCPLTAPAGAPQGLCKAAADCTSAQPQGAQHAPHTQQHLHKGACDSAAEPYRSLALQRLQRELRLAVAMPRCPGLLRPCRVYEQPSAVHVLYDSVGDYSDLLTYLRGRQRLPEASCRSIMRQVLQALAALHSDHWVHRNISMETVWVAEQETGGDRAGVEKAAAATAAAAADAPAPGTSADAVAAAAAAIPAVRPDRPLSPTAARTGSRTLDSRTSVDSRASSSIRVAGWTLAAPDAATRDVEDRVSPLGTAGQGRVSPHGAVKDRVSPRLGASGAQECASPTGCGTRERGSPHGLDGRERGSPREGAGGSPREGAGGWPREGTCERARLSPRAGGEAGRAPPFGTAGQERRSPQQQGAGAAACGGRPPRRRSPALRLEVRLGGLEHAVRHAADAATGPEPEPLRDLVGSAYHLSPEAVSGAGYGRPADIWAAGVLLFMLLTGRPPFPGQNELEVMTRVLLCAAESGYRPRTHSVSEPGNPGSGDVAKAAPGPSGSLGSSSGGAPAAPQGRCRPGSAGGAGGDPGALGGLSSRSMGAASSCGGGGVESAAVSQRQLLRARLAEPVEELVVQAALESRAGAGCREALAGMLAADPAKRMGAAELLQLPWFVAAGEE